LFLSFLLLGYFLNLLNLSCFLSSLICLSSVLGVSFEILSIFHLCSWIWNIHHRKRITQLKSLVNIDSFIGFNTVSNFINLLSSDIELNHFRIFSTVESFFNWTWHLQGEVTGCFIVVNILWTDNFNISVHLTQRYNSSSIKTNTFCIKYLTVNNDSLGFIFSQVVNTNCLGSYNFYNFNLFLVISNTNTNMRINWIS